MTLKPSPLSKLTRWNPLRELEVMQDRLENNFFGRSPLRLQDNGDESFTTSVWSSLDIVEDDQDYVIKAELPEVTKDDVKVSVGNGVLMISGERKFEKEDKNKKYHRVERAYGWFSRSFTLPEAVEPDGVKADFKDGMLTIHIPKSERARPKQIEVKVS